MSDKELHIFVELMCSILMLYMGNGIEVIELIVGQILYRGLNVLYNAPIL